MVTKDLILLDNIQLLRSRISPLSRFIGWSQCGTDGSATGSDFCSLQKFSTYIVDNLKSPTSVHSQVWLFTDQIVTFYDLERKLDSAPRLNNPESEPTLKGLAPQHWLCLRITSFLAPNGSGHDFWKREKSRAGGEELLMVSSVHSSTL